jgi:hypothetical protein
MAETYCPDEVLNLCDPISVHRSLGQLQEGFLDSLGSDAKLK